MTEGKKEIFVNSNYINNMNEEDRDKIRTSIMEHSILPINDIEDKEKKRILDNKEKHCHSIEREIYRDHLKGFDTNTLSRKYCLSVQEINDILKKLSN